MGVLQENTKLQMKVFGGNIVDFYKENSLYMYDKYSKSESYCKSISISEIQIGGFYHFHYLDDSNWMKWSPVFVCDSRKLDKLVIILAVNFNFIPLEIRTLLFDKFIIQKDIDENRLIPVDFKGMYTELIRLGFEYAIVEYNAAQLKLVHRISLEILPRFLYSSYPKNKYDPNKLMEIWKAKLDGKEERHKEMTLLLLDDMYKISKEINDKYSVLGDHIDRVRKSLQKFG
jgi:thiol-disulfide isomerase/thioredoxin